LPDDAPVDVDLPDWVPAAVRASQEHFDAEFADLRRENAAAFELTRAALLRRAERLYAYRRDRLAWQVSQAKQWLAEREGSDVSDRDRKILPARKGKLAADLERLSLLHERYELECEAIQAQDPTIEGSTAWAAVVVNA
jgi:hypothetical protein